MSSDSLRQSSLAYLLDLVSQINRDSGQPDALLHRRDRACMAGLADTMRDRQSLLIAWLDTLRSQGEPMPGHRVGIVYRLQLLLLGLLGSFAGWGTTLGVFQYDGVQPVNIVPVLTVFVGAQVLLLLLLVVVLLPLRITRWIPGLRALQELLSWISPGQLVRLVVRWLPQNLRAMLTRAFQRGSPLLEQIGSVQKWAIILAAQVFAVAFNLVAVGTFLYLVTFSDLAFSWSTTLEPDVQTVHRLTEMLSSPWAHWVPSAVPSAELLRETLYYRQSGLPTAADPAQWGKWWPFLLACMVVYGCLPRIVLLGVAQWRFSRAVRLAFLHAPGVSVVMDRLTTEWVTTQSEASDNQSIENISEPSTNTQALDLDYSSLCLVNWAGLEVPDETLQHRVGDGFNKEILEVYHTGGRASVEDDREVVSQLASTSSEVGVMVVVKAWEPPMLEITDFLRELRVALGKTRLLLVVPVGLDQVEGCVPPTEANVLQWEMRIRSLSDPAMVVRPWPRGVAL